MINSLAFYMQMVAAALMIVGALQLLVGLAALAKWRFGSPANVVEGLLAFVIGVFTKLAADSFARIRRTEGNEIGI